MRETQRLAAPAALLLLSGPAQALDLDAVDALHDAVAEHVDQEELVGLVRGGDAAEAFELAFESGDELFETVFNALDGVGANVGDGSRFTRTPRADLRGPGEWASHFPERATGPNASSCNSCHNLPEDDGAGLPSANVHRDPLHSAELGRFIQRNTPHLFAPGAVQRLAEEMTERLHAIRDGALREACRTGTPVTRRLVVKGVSFGELTASPTGAEPCAAPDVSRAAGVDADLVVRPFQWKGSEAFLRAFNRGASHNELGMQAVEIAGDGIDGDGDGVADELTVGDQTALAVYLAAQPRPTTRVELARLGLVPALPREARAAIGRGEKAFREVGCADCHLPRLAIDDPIFREPSRLAAYRDAVFPAGQDPLARGVDPEAAVAFDLTRDQPDNQIRDARGRLRFHLGALPRDARGRAQVDLYGDLKRHDIGPGLAEAIDETGSGASTFLTENLWGVGSTAPYLHDGRATTLTEAILLHGGESQASRDAFAALDEAARADLIAFLDDLVLFKLPEAQAAAPAPHPALADRDPRRGVRSDPMAGREREAAEPFDPYAPSSDRRYAEMERVRSAGGVAETPAGWYVATAAGVRAGLFDVERFVGSFVDTASMHPDDVVLSAIPEPRHGRIRRIVNGAIAGHRTARAEPWIRAQALRLVEGAVAIGRSAGRVDVVREAVDPLPSTAIAHMLGVPVADQERFRIWSDELLAAQGASNGAGLAELHPAFGAYIQALIDARRAAADPDDIVTRLIQSEVEGERLSDRMIRTQTMFLIVAGNETTRNLIGNCLHRLATSPALYRRVRAERGLLPALIEESLRHDSPVQVLGRAVLADTAIEGCPLRAGERVVFGIASANRDERAFECPAEFRLDRPHPRDHLAFGTGPHVCPGAALARLETEAFLEAFCARVAAFRLAEGATPERNPVFWANGWRSLVVALEASS